MNKRLSFIWTLSAVALTWAGCGGDACDTAEETVATMCDGVATGGWMCPGGDVADACNTCVDEHFAGGGACGDLGEACRAACCPAGTICMPPTDGGPPPSDAGDGGPPPPMGCGAVGQMGGTCRSGTVCASTLTCFEELTSLPSTGAPLTIGSAFGIESGTEDPSNPGEYIASGTDSDIPIGFAPGGQCSQACNPAATDDGCGMCATCSTTLGGSDAWGGVGIGVRSFDVTSSTNDARPGICRLNCQWSPTSNDDCPDGYTCDPAENICVEACVDSRQCNVGWGVSRAEGLVAFEVDGSPYTCNDTTGQCTWSAPSAAGLNTACEDNSDCPFPGLCLIGGYCATLACADNAGMIPGPAECAGACIGFGGNNGSVCVQPCSSPSECNPGQACSPFNMPLPSGETGFCFGVCDSDSECRSTERCQEIRPDDPDTSGTDESLSVCSAFCDPPGGATVADAITCEADEICTQDGTNDWGYCEPVGQLCFADDDCNGTQACEVLADDFYGRCVDGCQTSADCTGGEYCVRQPADGGGLEDYGVCRADAEMCAPSPTRMDGSIIQPLRGNAQCPPGQTCSSTSADTVGTCMGTITVPDGGVPADAGTPDGGV